MTDFTQSRFSNGEDLESVRILLETEWPQMIDRVEVSWLRMLCNLYNTHNPQREVKGRGWKHGGSGKSNLARLGGIMAGEDLWRREDNLVIQ